MFYECMKTESQPKPNVIILSQATRLSKRTFHVLTFHLIAFHLTTITILLLQFLHMFSSTVTFNDDQKEIRRKTETDKKFTL